MNNYSHKDGNRPVIWLTHPDTEIGKVVIMAVDRKDVVVNRIYFDSDLIDELIEKLQEVQARYQQD